MSEARHDGEAGSGSPNPSGRTAQTTADEAATKKVDRLIFRTTIASAALGVVLSPIPLADEILLVPIYGVMSVRIGRARGVKLGALPWKPIGTAVVAGLAARAAANVSFAFVPGVAAVANAISAAALTKIIGAYVDKTCKDGKAPESPFSKKDGAKAPAASPQPA